MKDRLLILAPRGRDAEVASKLFTGHGVPSLVCRDIAALLDAIEEGAGAVMLTEEVLAAGDADRLADWISAQPAWSDLPFIVLANGHRVPRSERALQRLQVLGNTVLLERPLHAEAMLGAVRSALKARSRQYQVRDVVAELRESERDMRFTLKAGRLGAWTLDLSSGELITSETCRTNFGRDPDAAFSYAELRGAVHPDDLGRMAGAVEESLASGADYDIEYRIITPDGEVRWVLIRAQPSYGPDGAPLRMTGVSIDVTDRKRDEARRAALAELSDAIRDRKDADDLAYIAAEILGRALGVSRAGYGTIDTHNETILIERDWNAPGVTSIAGMLSFRDYGTYIDDLKRGETACVSDSDLDPRTADTSDALKAISARSFINMPVTEQGDFVALIFVNHAERRRWTDPEVALVREVAERTRTAVERLRAEAELRNSEARYRELFEAIDAGFAIVELKFDDSRRPIDLRFVEVNPAFRKQLGLAGVEGRWASEAAPMVQPHWYEAYGRVALSGTPARWENEFLGRWYEVHAFRTGEPDGHRVAVLFNDISDRRRAVMALRDLNETLELQVAERTAERDRTWRLSQDMLMVIEADGTLVAVNQAWTDILGWHASELIGRAFTEVTHPDDLAGVLAGLRAIVEKPVVEPYEYRMRRKDGEYRWIAWTAAFEGGRAFANGRDITERKARDAELALAQEALRQSQKMEAMGSLTGGVAHDFNNLLTPIVGSLDMLQRKGLGGEREQRLIAGAIQSADRAKTLVQRLLAFARRQPLQATAVDLAPLVRGMADLVSSTTGPQIKVIVETAEDLPPAKADPNQLEMAILNLAVNARDAMPDGGTLRISIDVETIGRQHRADVAPGRYLLLSVADTGMGMDDATIKRAIEPFFSTKGIGKGTGLGLSMAHGLASQLGGALTIRSTPGIGTNIELWLPQSAAAPTENGDLAADRQPAAKGSGTALLVDDEDLVRLSTADMLTELGYTVIEASSGEEALKLVDRGLRPDLLITDHLMPGITGTELARTLHSSRPRTKILIVSGYAETEGIEPDLPRLTKPFRSADLAESLAALG